MGQDPPQSGEPNVLCLNALRRDSLERLAYIPDLHRIALAPAESHSCEMFLLHNLICLAMQHMLSLEARVQGSQLELQSHIRWRPLCKTLHCACKRLSLACKMLCTCPVYFLRLKTCFTLETGHAPRILQFVAEGCLLCTSDCK